MDGFCTFSRIKLPGKKEKLWDGYNINKKQSSNEDFKKLKSKGTLQKECPSWVLTSNMEMKTISRSFKKIFLRVNTPHLGHSSDLLASSLQGKLYFLFFARELSHFCLVLQGRIACLLSKQHSLARSEYTVALLCEDLPKDKLKVINTQTRIQDTSTPGLFSVFFLFRVSISFILRWEASSPAFVCFL